jgi:CRISPR-associated protein Csm3
VKSENSIDRVKGTAQNPRFIERVPEGTEFDFTVSFKVLHEGEEELFEAILFKGLKLIEMDALGGSGSRGYGRVQFVFADTGVQERFTACNPF